MPTPAPRLSPSLTPFPNNVFVSTANMSFPRVGHAAARLADGRVLVAGGNTGSNRLLDSSEIFDPSTGDWTKAASLQIARDDFTMTLLNDGRVLAAGGQADEGEIGAVEIYDPDLDTWQLVEGMNMFRSHHTANLLANGQVLVVGGYAYPPATDRSEVDWKRDTAEIFDPGTNTFYLVGRKNYDRVNHSVTLLPNGRALILGGLGEDAYTSAEIFDPATGSFSLTRNLVVGRRNTDIVLLQDGTVFIRGGFGDRSSRSAEFFDPVSGQFEPIPALDGIPIRYNHVAILLASGDVLTTGGTSGREALSSVELYSSGIESFRPVPDMGQAREGHAVVELIDGRVLVIGGIAQRGQALSSVEIYHP